MSGYCECTKPAALFGDTNLAGGIPHRSRILSRATLPDPAVPPTRSQTLQAGPLPAAWPVLHASTGPVYLEGRLVLSLSFKLESPTGNHVAVPEGEPLLERYRIWDDAAHDWLHGSPCVLRFESADVVMQTQPQPAIAWAGPLNLRCPIIGIPDLDEQGIAVNRAHRLRWKLSETS